MSDSGAALAQIVKHIAAGTLDAATGARAIAALLADDVAAAPPSTREALAALADRNEPALAAVRLRLEDARLAQAERWHQQRARGAPDAALARDLADLPLDAPPWASSLDALDLIRRWLREARDARTAARAGAPRLAATIAASQAQIETRLRTLPWPWHRPGVARPEQLVDACRGGASPALSAVFDAIGAWIARERTQPDDGCPDLAGTARIESLDAACRIAAPAERAAALEALLAWPDDRARPPLAALAREAWSRQRVALALNARFGRGAPRRLAEDEGDLAMRLRAAIAELHPQRLELLRLWCRLQPGADIAWQDALAAAQIDTPASDLDGLVQRWREQLHQIEAEALVDGRPSAIATRTLPRAASPSSVAAAPQPTAATTAPPPAPITPPTTSAPEPSASTTQPLAPRETTRPASGASASPARDAASDSTNGVWRAQVARYLTENWFLVAGIAMLIVGPALLASYAWDRSWLVRFTILPLALAGLTALLGESGRWLERLGAALRGTAAAMRAAAIGLLPVNAMAVALLARDRDAPHRNLLVPIASFIYLALGAWAARRWTRPVLPIAGGIVAAGIVCAFSPAFFPPLALAWTGAPADTTTLAIAVHAALIGAGAAFLGALRHADRERATDAVVAWFALGTLAGSWLGGLIWSHVAAGTPPWWPAFAPAAVGIGALAFVAERKLRALYLRDATLGPEAWTGFAALAIAAALGMGDARLRPAALAAAGLVWLAQGRARGAAETLHAWIGLTLLALAGAALALVRGFPPAWSPAIGLGLIALGACARRRSSEPLAGAIDDMQGGLAVLTTIAAALTQWHLRSAPTPTAAAIALCAAVAARRARSPASAGWTLVAMALAASALPYAGLVDLERRTLHGNHLIAGVAALSWAWLGWCRAFRSGVARPARSTVLWAYGAIALAALALRVLVEGRGGDDGEFGLALDLIGPPAMAAALLLAAWTSHSLVPAGMAVTIAVILLPELRTRLEAHGIALGSGLGSAVGAIAMLAAALRARRLPRLASLTAGDELAPGVAFPLVRRDHSLVTWPLVGGALYLLIKIDTVVVARHLPWPPLKPSIAIALSGVGWMLAATYMRAAAVTIVGWCALGFGVALIESRLARAVPVEGFAAALAAIALGDAAFTVAARSRAWVEEILAAPTRWTTRFVALAGALVTVAAIVGGRGPWGWVVGVETAVAVALALRDASWPFGAVAWMLGMLAMQAWIFHAHRAPLIELWRWDHAQAPLFAYAVASQALAYALRRFASARAEALALPAQRGASLLATIAGVALLATLCDDAVAPASAVLAIAATLLAARAEGAAALVLLASAIGYLASLHDVGHLARLTHAAEPRRIAATAIALALLAQAGAAIATRWPRLLRGERALIVDAPPLLAPTAALAAAIAWLLHLAQPTHRDAWAQLPAPYLAAATIAVIAARPRRPSLAWPIACALTTGNICLVRLAAGAWLEARGLSEIHLAVVGLALTLAQAALVRGGARSSVAPIELALASAMLVALGVNYVADPDLPSISVWRFVVSGAMAAVAAVWFRASARAADDPARVARRTIGYHAGLAVALWCAGLALPPLRSPAAALIALALPVAWFHLAAELHPDARSRERWLRSACVATAALLAIYGLRAAFQAVAFPGVPVEGRLYHANSWLAIALGLLALRQRGLGGGGWCGLIGGPAVMVGVFFLVTWLPGLSPFTDAAPAAAVALVLAHIGIALVAHATPVATLARRLAGADGVAWLALRRRWGDALLAGASIATANAVDAHDAPRAVAPLVAGLASVLVHLGVLRRRAGELIPAAALLVLALHLDAWIPSWLPLDDAVWALLAWWAALTALRAPLAPWLPTAWSDRLVACLATLVAGHVAWHRPWSEVGLAATAAAALLTAATPRDRARATQTLELIAVAVVVVAPAWIAFWWAARVDDGIDLLRPEPWLALGAAIAASGAGAAAVHRRWSAAVLAMAPARPRIAHQLACELAEHGGRLATGARWAASALAVAVALIDPDHAFAPATLAVEVLLCGGLAVDWFVTGRRERSLVANVAAQALVVFAVAALRRQLALTTDLWRPEYDVWAALLGTTVAAAAKRLAPAEDRELQLPLAAALLAAPALALWWTWSHGLGSDLALAVIGLHTAVFAWLGRGDRDSPYQVVAVAGAVAFVLVVFAGKLGLRDAHAYVVPPCIGLLVLDHLFAARTTRQTRAGVRAIAIAAMLGSSGWYAIADDRHPVAFHAVFLALALAAMAAGAALRVRLYLAAGFAAVLLDLLALVARVLAHADRSARVAALGAVVLLVGAALVGGAIAYKLHREAIDGWITRWRERLARWE